MVEAERAGLEVDAVDGASTAGDKRRGSLPTKGRGSSEVALGGQQLAQAPAIALYGRGIIADVIAKTVGADPADIQSTFVGAVCRWQAANPGGLVDITRFWFEQGSLDNEKKVAAALNYQVETKNIAGVPSILMHSGDACGVASDAGGVVGWWVNPQAPGIDACGDRKSVV